MELFLPVLMGLGVLAHLAAIFAVRRMTSPWRRLGVCEGCGYSLHGLPESACCPECGRSKPSPPPTSLGPIVRGWTAARIVGIAAGFGTMICTGVLYAAARAWVVNPALAFLASLLTFAPAAVVLMVFFTPLPKSCFRAWTVCGTVATTIANAALLVEAFATADPFAGLLIPAMGVVSGPISGLGLLLGVGITKLQIEEAMSRRPD